MINEGEGGSPSSMVPPPKVTKQTAIFGALSREIAEGTYTPDTQLPTEAQLCERFGVSRITVQGALNRLATAGLIKSVHGHGWFVRSEQRRRYVLTFDQSGWATRGVWGMWLQAQGLVGSCSPTVTTDLPPRHIAEHLRLGPEEKCVIRRELRSIDGEPVMIYTGYWPLALADETPFVRVATRCAAAEDEAPLDIMAGLGHASATEEDLIGARMPYPHEVEDLKLLRGVSVITKCQIAFDAHGNPLQCVDDVMVAERVSLVVESRPTAPFDLEEF